VTAVVIYYRHGRQKNFVEYNKHSRDYSAVNRRVKMFYKWSQSLSIMGERIGNEAVDIIQGKTTSDFAARDMIITTKAMCSGKIEELKIPVRDDFPEYKVWRELVISYLRWQMEDVLKMSEETLAIAKDTSLSQHDRCQKLISVATPTNTIELEWKDKIQKSTINLYDAMNRECK
jgi:hypothetical protein